MKRNLLSLSSRDTVFRQTAWLGFKKGGGEKRKKKKNNRTEEWWSPRKKLNSVMDGQGLQTLKPPPSVIHCHPAIISESLIHFASVWDLAKSITVAPICVCSGGGEAGAGGGRSGEGGTYRKDKLTARHAVSKHSLSCNNHLASLLARGMGRTDQIGF